MTAQQSDVLIWNGEEYRLLSTPLEALFGPDRPRPRVFGHGMTKACLRGYVARWRIENCRLCLEDAFVPVPEGEPTAMEELFPDHDVERDGPVFAEWFTGTLRAARGEVQEPAHSEFGTIYQEEWGLVVAAGVVTHSRKLADHERGTVEGVHDGDPDDAVSPAELAELSDDWDRALGKDPAAPTGKPKTPAEIAAEWEECLKKGKGE